MPRQYLFPDGARFGSDNVVLHARAKRHTVSDFAGPLSIKTVVHGAVPWIVGGRPLVVDPGSFLVLGDGEKYSMDVDVPYPIETACAFFHRGFVERVAQDATDPVERRSTIRSGGRLRFSQFPGFISTLMARSSAACRHSPSAAAPSFNRAASKRISCCSRNVSCFSTIRSASRSIASRP